MKRLSYIKLYICVICILLILTGYSHRKVTFEGETSIEEEKNLYNKFHQMEINHFILHFTKQDKEAATEIGELLEDKYPKIIEDLSPDNLRKIHVKIYPSLKDFHNAMGWKNYPDWVVGTAYGLDEIRMVSPNNPGPVHDYETIIKVAVHEFTHVVTNYIANYDENKAWLWESIALFEADQFNDPSKLTYLKTGNYPAFTKITSSFNDPRIYDIGYTIIEYINEKWGMEKVRVLLTSKDSLDEILGISTEELEKGWYEYIKDKYF